MQENLKNVDDCLLYLKIPFMQIYVFRTLGTLKLVVLLSINCASKNRILWKSTNNAIEEKQFQIRSCKKKKKWSTKFFCLLFNGCTFLKFKAKN